MFADLQLRIIQILSVAAFLGAAWAFIQGMRFPDRAYVAAGKLNKLKWGLILGVALVITFLALPWPLGIGGGVMSFGVVVAIAAVIIFFVDVLPKLRENYQPGRSKQRDTRGGW